MEETMENQKVISTHQAPTHCCNYDKLINGGRFFAIGKFPIFLPVTIHTPNRALEGWKWADGMSINFLVYRIHYNMDIVSLFPIVIAMVIAPIPPTHQRPTDLFHTMMLSW